MREILRRGEDVLHFYSPGVIDCRLRPNREDGRSLQEWVGVEPIDGAVHLRLRNLSLVVGRTYVLEVYESMEREGLTSEREAEAEGEGEAEVGNQSFMVGSEEGSRPFLRFFYLGVEEKISYDVDENDLRKRSINVFCKRPFYLSACVEASGEGFLKDGMFKKLSGEEVIGAVIEFEDKESGELREGFIREFVKEEGKVILKEESLCAKVGNGFNLFLRINGELEVSARDVKDSFLSKGERFRNEKGEMLYERGFINECVILRFFVNYYKLWVGRGEEDERRGDAYERKYLKYFSLRSLFLKRGKKEEQGKGISLMR